MKMRHVIIALFATLMAWSAPAYAEDRPVLLELYTSQGCSSCPPADAMLARIANSDNIIALALHVDYWDYLGWRDAFASPQYVDRQRAYARVANHRTIYTPQFVLHGQRDVAGYRPDEIARYVAELSMEAETVDLHLTKSAAGLTIDLKPVGNPVGRTIVQVVRYSPAQAVDIKRGENAGNRIVYANIVTDWKQVARWNGRGNTSLRVPLSGSEPVVVIVQADGPGPVLAVRRLR